MRTLSHLRAFPADLTVIRPLICERGGPWFCFGHRTPDFQSLMNQRLIALLFLFTASMLGAQPLMERLDRGVVAVHQPDGSVFVSWRLLADDPESVAFNLYRTTAEAEDEDWGIYASRSGTPAGTAKVNEQPLSEGTWFIDTRANLARETSWFVRPVVDGSEGEDSARFTLPAGAEPLPYHEIPLQTPTGYRPNDASVADLDGDGQLEIIVKQEMSAQDNSRPGITEPVHLQAYKLDGTMLWDINLGINVRAGAHYTQFMVYDLDGDGYAELICKTGDGTMDGQGGVIGDPEADHRNEHGYIITGPEYLTVFDGRSGAEITTVDYIPSRHPSIENPNEEEIAEIWGDGYGNRLDRFLAAVAYLDGETPSVVMARGYYTRSVLVAWDLVDGELRHRWTFDSSASEENRAYAGQGNHNLSVADVDGDGRQEIIYGAMVIDDDGSGLYSTGWGHGDAMHVTDHVPSNPGLEVFSIQERFDDQGMNMRDAESGKPIFLVPSVKAAESGGDRGEGPGRGLAINMDPRWPGSESWAAGAGMSGVFNAAGERIFEKPRDLPVNFAVWWDGDLQRELLDQNFVLKWDWETESLKPLLIAQGSSSNNGTKATPTISGDLWGDWREEIIFRRNDNQALRLYTSTIPTPHRMVTLLHDPQYRMALAWQNVAYNQPPHPSFYLGDEAPLPERPEVRIPKD